MRRFGRILVSTALVAAAMGAAAPPASAAFHFMSVKEVFAGTGDHANAQYVELQMYTGNQQFVAGHRVIIYSASDTELTDVAFATPGSNSANQATFLVATTAAETLFGVTADLEMNAVLPAAGGAACFFDNMGDENIDCVAWGNFVDGPGGATDVGTPFNTAEGIPSGAAIQRRTDVAGSSTVLDAADDTQNSANDFRYAVPSPDNNSSLEGAGDAPGGALRFSAAGITHPETNPTATIEVTRTGDTTGHVMVSYSTADGTADASDYTSGSGSLMWEGGDAAAKTFDVPITSDSAIEPDETVSLKLRAPMGGAVLGVPLEAVLTIHDEGDSAAPTSRVTHPDHGDSYLRGRFKTLRGTATDDATGINRVQVALRRTMTNGKCRWWMGGGWSATRSCSSKVFRSATGGTTWSYGLSSLLPKSRGTTTKHYTAFSRAFDGAGNIEASFSSGRNANRFEIR